MLPKLPLDISTFRELRKSNYLYVDKTRYAYDLITGGRRYFLSRPRRFGKSLLISTLKEILLGQKDLFEGLWIAKSGYSWQQHGVIALDFSLLSVEDAQGFKSGLIKALIRIAKSYGITEQIDTDSPGFTLQDIVEILHRRFGRVAILIDEYDNPILNALSNPEKATGIRDAMKHFFAVIKGLDEYVNFVLITGVSSFTRAGLFSGINNLQVITLSNKYSAICGYTDQEIDHYFNDYIQTWAHKKNLSHQELRGQIKDWYNGYQFGENVPTVYNPFSLMNALAAESFKNFWIKSGTPTFLIEQLKRYYGQHGDIIVDFEGLEVSDDVLQSFDIGEIPLPALMFQAGYLTLSGYNEESGLFSLEYPNKEVETAVNGYLLEMFTNLNTHVVDQAATHLNSLL